MDRHDYILVQAREFGAFLARLAGLAQNGQTEEALRLIEQDRQHHFDLPKDFTEADLLALSQSGCLNATNCKQLAELWVQKSNLLPLNSAEHTQAITQALKIYHFYTTQTATFDLHIQSEIARLQNAVNHTFSSQPNP